MPHSPFPCFIFTIALWCPLGWGRVTGWRSPRDNVAKLPPENSTIIIYILILYIIVSSFPSTHCLQALKWLVGEETWKWCYIDVWLGSLTATGNLLREMGVGGGGRLVSVNTNAWHNFWSITGSGTLGFALGWHSRMYSRIAPTQWYYSWFCARSYIMHWQVASWGWWPYLKWPIYVCHGALIKRCAFS